MIDYTITVYADTEEQAADYLQKLSVDEEKKEAKLNLSFKEARVRAEYVRSVRVDYEIKMPKGMYNEITNNQGAIVIEEINGDLQLFGTRAPITVKNVTGSLDVTSKFSEFEIININGDIHIKPASGVGYIAGVRGNVDIDNRRCDVLIEDITGNLKAVNHNGNLEVTDLDGGILIESSSGDVRAEEVSGTVEIEQIWGDIDLENIAGNINASTESGNIRLELLEDDKGYQILATTHGFGDNIRTRLPLAIVDIEEKKEASGVIGNGERTVKLEIRTNGNISIK